MLALRNLNTSSVSKENRYDSFFAGLLGGYAVFGRHQTSVTQQVCHTSLKRKKYQELTGPDRHLRFRPRGPLPRQTLRRT